MVIVTNMMKSIIMSITMNTNIIMSMNTIMSTITTSIR